ncbi:MAG TPA: molybdopterin-dependent oxidoreductase, partial [Solirubrobacterales bacterium]
AGKSRFTDAKRHFEKPIELSPLIALDRERCILCYRCVRFSQEVSEDAQLQLLERGDRTFVGTFDERPYVAPFHGNITDICPVGALTNYTYRFRARPWDIEQAGSVCTLCPSQCNVSFTVRDERVKRVVTRDNAEVDDGWLCDRGRYGFEMFVDSTRIDGPRLRGGAKAGWEQAIAAAASGLREAGAGRVAALVGDASNEEAHLLQRILREALDSPHVDSRPSRGAGRGEILRLSEPALSARVRDIDDADAILVLGTDPLHSSPILDLRVRKAIRRNGARLAVATERPTALDGGAEATVRFAPGGATAFLFGLAGALRDGGEGPEAPIADVLRGAGKVVILWGERIARDGATAALLDLAATLGLADTDGSGLLEVPDFANARGLREAGCLPDAGPGLSEVTVGKPTEEIRAALEAGEIDGLILFGVDPIRDFPDTKAWESALTAADHLVVFSMHENVTSSKADVLFPLETHAEKDGTVTHPDGRLQRVRPSAGRPGDVRPGYLVLSELASALGLDTGIDSQPTAFAALTDAVRFYNGIDDALIGGRGVRWQDTPAAANLPQPATVPSGAEGAGAPSERFAPLAQNGPRTAAADSARQASEEGAPAPSLSLGTYRDLWAGPITELNPPLRFLTPRQHLELSVTDAERLGLKPGETVRVVQNGTGVHAIVQIKERVPEGVCFLAEGVSDGNANALMNGGPVQVQIEKLVEAGV